MEKALREYFVKIFFLDNLLQLLGAEVIRLDILRRYLSIYEKMIHIYYAFMPFLPYSTFVLTSRARRSGAYKEMMMNHFSQSRSSRHSQ